MYLRDIVPNGMSFESVNPPFPLLKIDWIPGKVPVSNRGENPTLPDLSKSWPERTVGKEN